MALVQSQQQFVTAASISFTFPTLVTPGNLLVAWVSAFAVGPPTWGGNITTSGIVQAGTTTIGAGGLAVWQQIGIVTGSGNQLSVTVTGSPYTYLIVGEFSNAPASAVLDGTVVTNNSPTGSPPTVPVFTSTNPNSLIIGVCNIQGAGDTVAPASPPWSNLPILNAQMSATYQIVTSTGTFQPVWQSAGNTGWVTALGGIVIPVQPPAYQPGYPVSALIEEPSEGTEQSNVVPQP
jgi:hypothetical protein